MTYQRDPDPVERTRPRLRRDDDSWGMLPILLGLVFLVMIGFFAFGMFRNDTTPTNSSSAQAPSVGTTTPNTTTNQPNQTPRTNP